MLIHWDCLEKMDKLIEQWVVIDAIITDPPYWTVKNLNYWRWKNSNKSWDTKIELKLLLDK